MASRYPIEHKSCFHLRSKEMFYEGAAGPETQGLEGGEEERPSIGAADTRAYWCHCTQGARGPDGKIVGREECAAPGRQCFVSIESLA